MARGNLRPAGSELKNGSLKNFFLFGPCSFNVQHHRSGHLLSLEFWRKQATDDIVKSLEPGNAEALKVKPDGRIMNGNTRVKVLEERGFDVNSLPREVLF